MPFYLKNVRKNHFKYMLLNDRDNVIDSELETILT